MFLDFTFLFLFSNQMLVISAGIPKKVARIANREDPDLGLGSLIRPFWQTTKVDFMFFTLILAITF